MPDEILEFDGAVTESGKIELPPSFRGRVVSLFSGVQIVVTVQRKRKRRSNDQNAYYWAVIVKAITDALNEQGENLTKKETHEFLKFRYLRYQKINEANGQVIFEYGRDTHTLKTHEFSIYLDQCIQFAAEMFGVRIPPPRISRDNYNFPEYQGTKENREAYVERIGEAIQEISHRSQLEKYFQQNPDWQTPEFEDIRMMFNERWFELSN